MTDDGGVVGQANILGLVGAAIGGVSARLLIDYEGALDVDVDGTGVGDGIVDFDCIRAGSNGSWRGCRGARGGPWRGDEGIGLWDIDRHDG